MTKSFSMPENTYFRGEAEAREYKFINVPTILLTDPIFSGISSDAKILYALLLDRMGLSIKNNWSDEEGRIYIYFTIEEVMKALNVKETRAKEIFKQLTCINGTQYSLITKVRQLNRPSRIYVHKFMDVYRLLSQNDEQNDEQNGSETMNNQVGRDNGRPWDADAADRGTQARPTVGRNDDRPWGAMTTDRGTQAHPTVGRTGNCPSVADTTTNNINSNNTDSVSVNQSNLSYQSILQEIKDGLMDVYQTLPQLNDYINSLTRWKAMVKRQEITDLFDFDSFNMFCSNNHLTLSQKKRLAIDVLHFMFPSYQIRKDQGKTTNVEEAMIGFMSDILSAGESLTINGVEYDNRYLCEIIFSLDDDEYISVVDTIKNTPSKIKDYKKYYMRCILEAHNNFKAELGLL